MINPVKSFLTHGPHLVHVVWSLKVRIVSELTKAPNFLQLIAYCSSMNIRRGAHEAC